MSSLKGFGQNARGDLGERGLTAKHSWGQNFLKDKTVLRDIAQAVGVPPTNWVVELGAGLGALTQALLHEGRQVLAIERDRDLIPVLEAAAEASSGRLVVEAADAAKLDYAALASTYGPSGLFVAGNLPYQLSSRLLVNMADAQDAVGQAVVMVQREVAERIVAGPGSRDYGLLSVLLQRSFCTTHVRDVPPGAFHPRPKVTSSVVRLRRRTDFALSRQDDWLLCQSARMGFSSRRKMLRRALLQSGKLASRATLSEVEEALRAANIDPEGRAETLSTDAFLQMGRALHGLGLLELS